MNKEDNSQPLVVTVGNASRVSSYRFVVLACLTVVLWAKGTIFNLYIPFVAFISTTYNQPQVIVVATVLIMQILYTPFSILLSDRIVTTYGLKVAFVLGCVLMQICMLLRCGINNWFYSIILASVIGAAGRPLLMNIPAKLSFNWFTASGRVAATTIALLAANLGGALGNFFPLAFIDDNEKNHAKGKSMIFNASVAEAVVFSSIYLVAVLLTFS